MTQHRLTLTALAFVAALVGCTATAPVGSTASTASVQDNASANTPQGQIRQRSTEFWQARQHNDVAAAYSYTSPSYRKVHDQEFFRVHYSGIPVVVSREIVDVQCDAALQRCILQNKYMVSPPMMGGGMVPVYGKEIWLQEDGQWWIFRE